jgi:hypothetical protein
MAAVATRCSSEGMWTEAVKRLLVFTFAIARADSRISRLYLFIAGIGAMRAPSKGQLEW